MSSEKFAKELQAAKGSRASTSCKHLKKLWKDIKRITQGRNAAEMSPNEYLKELFEQRMMLLMVLKYGHLRM